MTSRIGFVGLGDMGWPMAACLARAGVQPLIWARRAASAEGLPELGAELAPDIDALCTGADTICTMLAHADAQDEVFGRDTPAFARRLAGRTLVQMGTTAPGYSRTLAAEINAIGGRYVELPVSGSTGPAAQGALVAMAAGDPEDIARITPLVDPMVSAIVPCGTVPKALQMKLAVNAYLAGLIGGLLEAVDLAEASALDLGTLQSILEAGPMSNDLMRMKLPKLIEREFSPQGSIRQSVNNLRMITEAGAELGAPMPVNSALRAVFEEGKEAGLADEDMVAASKILRARRNGAGKS
ncbi:MAG: NAD(P)-dependent oxidoreductase [Pseudomonadota bacterium]